MKSIYYISFFLCIPLWLSAQSTDQNYIVTTVPTTPVTDPTTLTDANSLTTIQYFDGLGRPIETVQKAISGITGSDLVSLTEYDAVGREYKHWLPITNAGSGAYVTPTTITGNTTSLYGGDANPYTTTNFEPSPLNRVTGQYGAGASWYAGKKNDSILYQTNAGEVTYFFVNSSNKLQRTGSYLANTLYKTVVADEDGKTTTEYKDKQGQVVMKHSEQDGNVDTYYVFNDLGQLCYVLPPNAADLLTSDGTFNDNTTAALKKFAYLYKYDERGNNVVKRLPGCDSICMVYDKADRLVMSQDGNQRAASSGRRFKQWTVTKYDVLGRVLYTGLITDYTCSKTRVQYKALLGNQVITESYNGTTGFYNTGYTCSATIPGITPLTVNYYDDYRFRKMQTAIDTTKLIYTDLTGYDTQYSNAKGLLTGTRTYILDHNISSYLTTAIYYDDRGRVVQSRATNQLGGYDITYNHYNFTGKVLTSRIEHNKAGGAVVPEVYTNTYNQAGRPLTTTYQLNNKTPVILASNAYDELGRLTTKLRHNGIDTEAFEYNIRNWTTKITSGTFIENLYYNANPMNSNVCYNGNISYSNWTYNGVINSYNYVYDNLNRLNSSTQNFGSKYFESFTYDKQGNIKGLSRWNSSSPIDGLTITYDGNQIKSVTDQFGSKNMASVKEYQNKSNTAYEFSYDQNGNMIKDLDRDIVTIKYNILNLPDTIQFKNGNQIINRYAADGRKLGTEYFTRMTALATPIYEGQVCNWVYDRTNIDQNGTVYIDNKEYRTTSGIPANTSLSKVYNPEGYNISVGLNWLYYRKDHLGNNREVWYANYKTTQQRTQYYPSGLPWAEGLNPSWQSHKYNDKEFIEMHGYDVTDLGWRTDYNATFRFTTLDRKSEKYPWQSPYCVAADNPVRFIDRNGENPALAIPIVAGLTIIDLALIGTGVVTAGILWERGSNDRIQIKQDVKNAVNDFLYKDNPGKKEQDKREGNAKRELDQNQANMATAIKQNTPDPRPDGGSDPKRPLSEWKPITVVVTGIVIAKNIYDNITKPKPVLASATPAPAPPAPPTLTPTPIQPKQPWALY